MFFLIYIPSLRLPSVPRSPACGSARARPPGGGRKLLACREATAVRATEHSVPSTSPRHTNPTFGTQVPTVRFVVFAPAGGRAASGRRGTDRRHTSATHSTAPARGCVGAAGVALVAAPMQSLGACPSAHRIAAAHRRIWSHHALPEPTTQQTRAERTHTPPAPLPLPHAPRRLTRP